MTTVQDYWITKPAMYETVASYLRRKILLGHLAHGEHLNEAKIAEGLGVSRGPVRDALRVLEAEGLVETPKNGRSVVAGFDQKSFADWVRVRLELEKMAVSEWMEQKKANPGKIAELQDILDKMENLKHNPDIKLHIWLDLQFHRSLVRLSGNRTLVNLWNTLSGTLSTMLELIAENYDNLTQNEMHQQIFEKMMQGRKKEALEELEFHIQEGKRAIQSVVAFLK